MNLSSRAAAGVFSILRNMLHSVKPFAPTCASVASRRSHLDRSLLQQLHKADNRAYTCSSALLVNHEPQLPRHVPRSVAARAPSIKHQWDTESAKQVKTLNNRLWAGVHTGRPASMQHGHGYVYMSCQPGVGVGRC